MLKADKYPADYRVKAIVRTTKSPSKRRYQKEPNIFLSSGRIPDQKPRKGEKS